MTIVLKPLFSFLSKTLLSCKYWIENIILEPKLLFASSKRKIQTKFYREFNIANSLNILSFLKQWEEPVFSRVSNEDVEKNKDSNNVATREDTNDVNGSLKAKRNQTYIEIGDKSNKELISLETNNCLNKKTKLENSYRHKNKSDLILCDPSNHNDTENKENIVPNNINKKTKKINKVETNKFDNKNNLKIERIPSDDIKSIKNIPVKCGVSTLNHSNLNSSQKQQLSPNLEDCDRINDNLTTSTSKTQPNTHQNTNEMKDLIKTFQESMHRMEDKLTEMKEEVMMLRKHVSERHDQTLYSPSTIVSSTTTPLFIPPPPPLPPPLPPPKSFILPKQNKNKTTSNNNGSSGNGGLNMTELLKEIKTVRLKKTSRTPLKKKEEDENGLDHGSLLTSAFKNKFKKLNNSTDCEQEDDYGFDYIPSTSTWSARKFQPKTTPSDNSQAFGQHMLKRRTVLFPINNNVE